MSAAGRALKALVVVLPAMVLLTVAGASSAVIYATGLPLIAAVSVCAVVLPAGIRRPPRPFPARRPTPAPRPPSTTARQ